MADLQDLRRNQPALKSVTDYAQQRLEQHHMKLATPLLTERESDMVRGRIAELKKLIDMAHSTGEVDE